MQCDDWNGHACEVKCASNSRLARKPRATYPGSQCRLPPIALRLRMSLLLCSMSLLRVLILTATVCEDIWFLRVDELLARKCRHWCVCKGADEPRPLEQRIYNGPFTRTAIVRRAATLFMLSYWLAKTDCTNSLGSANICQAQAIEKGYTLAFSALHCHP